ncbi:LLM class flavin-dependent oxidoreductase [Phycicoccus sonneratiae]|uniref:LLM class flavin-dependent oxidoreductase n=1 Tax=Phycicoccus sonneratiae TaxID=2807628 RepID=A0ABS2CNW4_9MICO|nr:LLM class flavin-dependent oxidoreductase [Phycicoccus sonneraticus]MBM6401570.1 LLM class flavin-dependent oxidoreductase [Phycicoccus sonneraticus]
MSGSPPAGLATFGLLAPLTPVADRTGSPGPLDDLAEASAVPDLDALWLRDLPCVPDGDEDAGQGTDPFAHLSLLAGAGVLPPVVGIASVVLGTRHPLVLARAVATAQAHTGGRLVLGLGTGGKPPMNAALGLRGRTIEEFATEWRAVRAALAGRLDSGLVAGHRTTPTPPVYLATTGAERWRAVDGDADGWMAFLGDERAFDDVHAAMERVSARRMPVAVRADVIVREDARGLTLHDRGRVVGSLDAVGDLLARWRRHPAVAHLMVNVRSSRPTEDLLALRALSS